MRNIRMTGSPYSITLPHGGISCAYNEYVKADYDRAVEDNPAVREDVARIVYFLDKARCEVDPDVAFFAWREYCEQQSADWLEVPPDAGIIFECIQPFLVVEPMKEST